MTAVVLDGKATASEIKKELSSRITRVKENGIFPGLATVLVGNDPASRAYVNGKHRDCAELGIESIRIDLPATASQNDVYAAIDELNSSDAVTGYIVQLPLPPTIDTQAVLERIDPNKDADGLHPISLGRLVLSSGAVLPSPLPCTPAGILELLRRFRVPLEGKNVVVIGRGVTVGRPLGLLLTHRGVDATVTLTHSRTHNIADCVRQADIVVAAIGVAHFVNPEWVKPGAAVLDVGITRESDLTTGVATVKGDVDPAVASVAGFISPNPGGVGPMTRVMLCTNVVTAAERRLPR